MEIFSFFPSSQFYDVHLLTDDVASMRGSGSNSKISRNSSRDLRKNLSDQELEEKRSSRRDYQDRVPTLKDLSLGITGLHD